MTLLFVSVSNPQIMDGIAIAVATYKMYTQNNRDLQIKQMLTFNFKVFCFKSKFKSLKCLF